MEDGLTEQMEEYQQEAEGIIARERSAFGESENESPEALQGDRETLPFDFLRECFLENERGDARVLLELYRGRFVYDQAGDTWFEWQGHFWLRDRLRQLQDSVEGVAEAYGSLKKHLLCRASQAKREGKTEQAGNLEDFAELVEKRIFALRTKRRVLSVAYLSAVGRETFIISGDKWDQDPWLLGCKNGVIELRTGTFRDGRQGDWLKTVCPTEWKGIDEPAPTWERFLREILDEDKELIAYLQKLLGYAITGTSSQHEFYVLWGAGRNGKGTLLNTLKEVLGDLAGEVEAELLLSQRFSRHSGSPRSDIMSLRGKRLAWASEAEEGRRFNVSLLKWLVGGDWLLGREPYGREQVSWRPSHTLFLLTNHKPHASSDDFALWERIRLIPFTLSFVDAPKAENEKKRDPDLTEKLKAEAPGILAWLVRGCLQWQKKKELLPPEKVKAATQEYRSGEDTLNQFFADRCVLEAGAKVKASTLYAEYSSWCTENGIGGLTGTRFGTRIKERFRAMKEEKGIFYSGIGLMTDRTDGNPAGSA